MLKLIDRFFDAGEYFLTPMRWPLWARRTAVLTLPVSFPLWMVGVFAFMLIAAIPATAIAIAENAGKMWRA